MIVRHTSPEGGFGSAPHAAALLFALALAGCSQSNSPGAASGIGPSLPIVPTAAPSGGASAQPTGQASGTPSAQPSGQVSAAPSAQPSGQASAAPSAQPSGASSAVPSAQPTGMPSASASAPATTPPTAPPTAMPTTPPTPVPTAVPTPMPSIASTSGSQRPANNGDRYAFAGSKVQTDVFDPYAQSTPPPIPVPLPSAASSTVTTAVSQIVTVAYPAAFAGTANAYDFHVVESDVAPLQRTTITSDNYEQFPAAAAGFVYGLGSVSTVAGSSTDTTTYGTNSYPIDVMPEVPGTIAVAPPSLTFLEADPGGLQRQRATNGDGSYHEMQTFAGGTSATAVEASDGSGTYSVPIFNVGPPNATAQSMIVIGAPMPTTISISGTLPNGNLTPSPFSTTIANWYPNGLALPLAARSLTSVAVTSLPAGCTLPAYAVAGRAIGELRENDTRLDTIFGEEETTAVDTYTLSGLGPVCVSLSDQTVFYYDYAGRQLQNIGFGSTPFGSNTTTETLTLQTADVVGPHAVSRRSASAAATTAVAHAFAANFRSSLDRAATLRHTRMVQRLGKAG